MKIPLVIAYRKIIDRVGDISTLSWRKQVCIQYLKWGVFVKDEDKDLFIRMAIEWRKKEERNNGSKRTIVEKRMRRLLRKWNKRNALAPGREASSEFFQKQKREKTGVFDEEYRKTRQREVNRNSLLRQLERGRAPSSKEWIVTEPDGTEVRLWNLHQYALSKGLDRGNLSKTSRGIRSTHKGYRARLVNDEWGGD